MIDLEFLPKECPPTWNFGTITPMEFGDKMGNGCSGSLILLFAGFFFPLFWILWILSVLFLIAVGYSNMYWIVGDCPHCHKGVRIVISDDNPSSSACEHCKRTITAYPDGMLRLT